MSIVTAPARPETVTQVKHVPTNEMVEAFIAAILAGNPIGKIFPAKISEMEFTQEQRDRIKASRHQRKEWCKTQKARKLKELRSKSIEFVRMTERPTHGSIGYVDTKAVAAAKAAKGKK